MRKPSSDERRPWAPVLTTVQVRSPLAASSATKRDVSAVPYMNSCPMESVLIVSQLLDAMEFWERGLSHSTATLLPRPGGLNSAVSLVSLPPLCPNQPPGQALAWFRTPFSEGRKCAHPSSDSVTCLSAGLPPTVTADCNHTATYNHHVITAVTVLQGLFCACHCSKHFATLSHLDTLVIKAGMILGGDFLPRWLNMGVCNSQDGPVMLR